MTYKATPSDLPIVFDVQLARESKHELLVPFSTAIDQGYGIAVDVTFPLKEGTHRLYIRTAELMRLVMELSRAMARSAVAEESLDRVSAKFSGNAGRNAGNPHPYGSPDQADESRSHSSREREGVGNSGPSGFEGEVLKSDQVDVLAFEEIEAAAQQVADVAHLLFDRLGLGLDDVQSLFKGATKSTYLLWAQRRDSDGGGIHGL